MPTLCRFFGITIRMYFDDHGPPHFHAYYGEYSASVLLHTLEIKEGDLPKRARALVIEWASGHREELQRNWERA